MLPIIDVVLIIFLAGFVFYGLFFGLIKMVGYLAGLVVGAWVASHYYLIAFDYLKWMFFGHDNVGKVISFIIVLILVSRLVGFLFVVVEKIFNVLAVIPFIKGINRLAGAVFGFVEGLFTLGLILYVASRYAVMGTYVASQMANSKLSPTLVNLTNILSPMFPETLRLLQSVIHL
jgi:membrane protein required for colicin V production